MLNSHHPTFDINKTTIPLYFKSYRLCLRICDNPDSSQHYQLNASASSRFWFQLSPDDFSDYKGKLGSWFNSMMSGNFKAREGCWRSDEGSTYHCDGPSNSTWITLCSPVLMFIELGDSNPDEWELPTLLHPYKKKELTEEEQAHDPSYELIGRFFYQPSEDPEAAGHWIGRFTEPLGNRIYNYDDCRDGGYTNRVKKGTISTHLSGKGSKIGIPAGFQTGVAIYRLRGGTSAQEVILQRQTNSLKKLNISPTAALTLDTLIGASFTYTRPGIKNINSQPWISKKRQHLFLDYEDITPSAAKPKRSSKTVTKKPTKPLPGSKGLPHILDDEETDVETEAVVPMAPEALKKLNTSAPVLTPPPPAPAPVVAPPPPAPATVSVRCRCGFIGEVGLLQDGLRKVQCSFCNNWSHVSCQRDGRADRMTPKTTFICDECPRTAADTR